MDDPSLGMGATVLTTVCVLTASVTDLRWRRIPNWLTFPAIAAGCALWVGFLGWNGLALSMGGTFAAPLLLVVLHLGRGPGMGDIKLAAAVGSLLGLRWSPVAMVLSGLAGGLIALCLQLRSGGALANTLSPLFVGVPGLDRWVRRDPVPDGQTTQVGIPYALAIGIGSMAACAVFWCTKGQGWLR